MLHEMFGKYQWISHGVNVYLNVTWDMVEKYQWLCYGVNVNEYVTWKISMALLWSKYLSECYIIMWMLHEMFGKISMALIWSKCLSECYIRGWKFIWLSHGVNVYLNVT
jgi:hypothetical protein